MSMDVADVGRQAGTGRDVSGSVVHVLMGMVRAHRGEAGVAQVLALAGEKRSFAELADPTRWSSLPGTVALLNAAALVTGDGAVGLHVGEVLLFTPDAVDFSEQLRLLGSPRGVLEHIEPVIGRFDTTTSTATLELAVDHALVEVVPRLDQPRHAHLCEMTRGLLSQIPTLFDRDPALITETECRARGGRRCLYAVSWEVPDGEWAEAARAAAERGLHTGPATSATAPTLEPGPSARPRDRGPGQGSERDHDPDHPGQSKAELREQLNRMSVLVEGAFATSLELLDDDVETLLTQIAARADAVVSAHRYLLMVRVRPGTPIQLHHRGLDPGEAQRLAADLWRDHPGEGDASYLVVDIASTRRRYGRLVEFPPPGSAPSPWELRVLNLYAEYAATALDIFSVLTEAKRSDATARTLLSFSESLSRVTTLAELVQLLADTVPAVTHCDQSTVYLWDAGAGQLLPRARTAGLESPDSYSGPIVPIRPAPGSGEAGEHPDPAPVDTTVPGPGPGAGDPLTIATDATVIERMMDHREVMVLDSSTDDPYLSDLLRRSGTAASVVAPLFAAGEFLGVIAANFGAETPTASIHDPDLHERLSGLADQAATAVQNLELLEKVSHMAWHDALTGLPNRRLFEDRVEQELVRSRRVGEPVCMFFVDLDHFKAVNDTLGHAAGDDLIRQVSQRLVETVRAQDTVARVGGDEFAILLPGLADQLAIDQLAQRSLEALGAPFAVIGQEVETSGSIGIAMAPDHGDSYDELLSRADEAMYRAKDRGRNGFQMYSGSLVTSVHGRQAVDEATLYADLVHALEHDEFFLLFQPYIDLRTAQVVGVEALIRWDHPSLGVLEPSSFISMAERTDVIVALDTWVLQETCRQARAWLDDGLPPLRLSVNLATRDLANPLLFDNIHRSLMETGIDPSLLELEITERVVLDKSGPARQTIERLRRLGVRFTIDDFGTGNSSLNRIGAFPVSTLKIDQSFVQVLGPDADNNSLVSAIISMAARLGLDCVAEGVETSVQSRVLLQRGCTTAQGYYFSPPLPARDIEAMMADISTHDDQAVPADGPA
jgi:diguanylate cyclase (GGDEF)-like protein